jgi:hypothetical protein
MSRKELLEAIVAWAHARNIIKGTTDFDQWVKCASEVGELADGLAKDQPEMIKDAIGDVVVMLCVMTEQMRKFKVETFNPMNCLRSATAKETFHQMYESFGALGWTIRTDRREVALPYVNSVVTYLNHIALHCGMDFDECIAFAYDQIKDRKGVVFNGTFIKSNDARYHSALAELGLSE